MEYFVVAFVFAFWINYYCMWWFNKLTSDSIYFMGCFGMLGTFGACWYIYKLLSLGVT